MELEKTPPRKGHNNLPNDREATSTINAKRIYAGSLQKNLLKCIESTDVKQPISRHFFQERWIAYSHIIVNMHTLPKLVTMLLIDNFTT